MKYFKYKGILLFYIILVVFFVEARGDTASVAKSRLVFSPEPRAVLLSSALVPGLGQVLSRKYLKAGTFLALEAITVSTATFWDKTAQSRENQYNELIAQTAKDTGFSWAKLMETAHDKKFQTIEAEYKRFNGLTWAGGIYLYNLFDAFDLAGFFKDNGTRNPTLAFGLAAIPGLGLGQIYNGSFSKAGLIMMTQVSLGVLAYNNHRLMRLAETNYRRIAADTTGTGKSIKALVSADWEGKRHTAMRNRNQYLWYSIFTYAIGIADAIVDAHLHDYQEKMKFEPDLVPSENGTGLNLKFTF